MITTPPIYTQYLRDAIKIFQYAGWPQAAPQEIFSAPIDEEQDLNIIIINMFNNYMKEVSTVTPGQMYIPESFNGRLTSMISVASAAGAQSASQGGLTNYNFALVNGVSIPYGKAKMVVHRGGQETIKKQRYHKGARTVVTAKAVGGTTAFSMPVITPSPQVIRSSTGVPTTQIGQARSHYGYRSRGHWYCCCSERIPVS